MLVNETKKIFGVFDGASSLGNYLSLNGKTGAYIASNIASETFAFTDKNLKQTALEANSNIEKIHQEAGIDLGSNINRFGTTAAVVRLRDDKAELLQIGDSVIIFIYKDGHTDVPLGYHDHDLDVMRHWRKLADNGVREIRQSIKNDLLKLREEANSVYGLLNGDSKARSFIKIKTVNIENVATILVLTDGMYIPKENPESDEDWHYIAKLYREGGLDKIYETVRQIEETDPGLIKYPRYKIHDDASGVAIDI